MELGTLVSSILVRKKNIQVEADTLTGRIYITLQKNLTSYSGYHWNKGVYSIKGEGCCSKLHPIFLSFFMSITLLQWVEIMENSRLIFVLRLGNAMHSVSAIEGLTFAASTTHATF